MAKIKTDIQGSVIIPTLLLQNKRFETIGRINQVYDLSYKENFNSANEISFTIYKKYNGIKNPIWNNITNNKILYIPEYKERFIMKVLLTHQNQVLKSITATSLCENELSQIKLYNIEINTDNEISMKNYECTVFYNPDNPNCSLLHRLISKASHYSIGHVDESLMNIQRTFSISDTDLYSILVGEISEEFNCLFLFDSMNRTISAYDLYNTCNKCGYRGDFSDKCPECDSIDFSGKYGNDTTIFISNENLANEINLEPDLDSLKNCFYVEGGDEIINAAIRSINPNGTNYIYFFDDDTKKDMSVNLISALGSYDTLYNEYLNKEYTINTSNCSSYNDVVSYVREKFKDDKIIDNINYLPSNGILKGYVSTTVAMYETVNLYYFIKTSMMPTINTSDEGIEKSLSNIIQGIKQGFINEAGGIDFSNKIALINNTLAIKSDVERAIEKVVKIFFNTAYYTLDIITTSYTQATTSSDGIWVGHFKLTSLIDVDENGNDITIESEEITLYIVSNNVLYTQQVIYYAISDMEKLGEKQLSSIKMSYNDFKNELTYYSLDELNNIKDMFQSCIDVLIKVDNESNMDDDLLNNYKTLYETRINYIDEEKTKRTVQLDSINNIYYSKYESDIDEYMTSGELYKLRTDVINILNFEKYIKENYGDDTWKEFCAYKREDKYSNSNYISDGLADADVIEKAKELFEKAKKELFKAGSLQYSITTTMNNLLAIKDFKPLINNFSVGNWVRVGIDNKVYKLRLLSYQTDFDKFESIDVEFSTVEKIYNGYSDVESVIKSASSIASSYSNVVNQMNKTSFTANKVNNLVSNGLNATKTKFIDSDNEEIVIDNHGILARQYDYVKDIYHNYQLKILSNGLYTTSDGWDTIDTGIGKISYIDPNTGLYVNDYGLIAKTVVGKLFIGERLSIYGTDNSITLDENGITLDGTAIKWKRKLPTSSVDGLDSALTNFVDKSIYAQDISDLQKQIDGNITTWFYEHTPTVSNEPAINWKNDAEKIAHEGDLFYCTNSESAHAYRYVYNTITKEHEWLLIEDTDVTKALANAANAQDTADGKRRVFITTPIPPYDIGDLWSQGKSGDLLICISAKTKEQTYNLSDWDKASKYTDDTKALEALEKAEQGIKDAANGILLAENANSKIGEFDSQVANYLGLGGGTLQGENYIISPIIQGGYLDIVNTDVNNQSRVIIDPNNLTGENYIFQVCNGDEISVGIKKDGEAFFSGVVYAKSGEFAGELKSATGIFSGEIKFGRIDNGHHNFELTDDGLKFGVGNGGTTYNFKVESDGDIETRGSFISYGDIRCVGTFTLGGNESISYNTTNGLIFTNGKFIFKDNDDSEVGKICSQDDGMGIDIFSRNINIESTSGALRLNPGTFIELLGTTYINNLYIGKFNNSTCSVSIGTSGQLIMKNASADTIIVIEKSFSTSIEQSDTLDLGRANAKWKNIYASTSAITTSDKNMKKEISTIDEKYVKFFMKLIPVSFMFKNSTSGRTHIGFISQDVESAMIECGLSDFEFAGFCKDQKVKYTLDRNGNEINELEFDENDKPIYIYSLRYEEFIALNTYMIQSCIKKIEKLEHAIL